MGVVWGWGDVRCVYDEGLGDDVRYGDVGV